MDVILREYCQCNLSLALSGLSHLAVKAKLANFQIPKFMKQVKCVSRHIETLVCTVRCSNLLGNLSPLEKLFQSFRISILKAARC